MPPSTGFDPQKFANASRKATNDPWARREAWRYTGPFTRYNRFKGAFPGLGIATVAFTIYCGVEYAFFKDKAHGEHHGDHH